MTDYTVCSSAGVSKGHELGTGRRLLVSGPVVIGHLASSWALTDIFATIGLELKLIADFVELREGDLGLLGFLCTIISMMSAHLKGAGGDWHFAKRLFKPCA